MKCIAMKISHFLAEKMLSTSLVGERIVGKNVVEVYTCQKITLSKKLLVEKTCRKRTLSKKTCRKKTLTEKHLSEKTCRNVRTPVCRVTFLQISDRDCETNVFVVSRY